MGNVALLLKYKDSDVWTVGSKATVKEALELMAEKNVGALPVVEQDRLIGIFSERDLARQAARREFLQTEMAVSSMMTACVHVVTSKTTIEECMEIMTRKRVRHLPVVEDEKMTGIISIGDVVNALIEEQKKSIEQLQKYISGTS